MEQVLMSFNSGLQTSFYFLASPNTKYALRISEVGTIRNKIVLAIGKVYTHYCTWYWQRTHQGKRPPGRPRQRWEDGIKRDVESLVGGPDWKAKVADTEIRGLAVRRDGPSNRYYQRKKKYKSIHHSNI